MIDLEKKRRDEHMKEKVEKLKNPNNFVSTTRIMLKNLPKKHFYEDELKSMV
jgi:hypothetical protein